jgi:putative ABC transport system substrate-binding protein
VPAAQAAKNATTTIPIVFIAGDPLGSGLVASLARPGGNLTGLSISVGEDFSGKWLELLREAVPKVSLGGRAFESDKSGERRLLDCLRGVAQKLGVKLQAAEVRDPAGFDSAFESMSAERAQALVVVVDPLTVRYRGRIAELAAKYRLPAMYGFREFAEAGGLMAYGRTWPTCVGAPVPMWTRSSRAPSQPISRSSNPPSSNSSST